MTAEKFLAELAGDFRSWKDKYLWVTGFSCSPNEAGNKEWAGYALNGTHKLPPLGLNGYFSVGVLNSPRRLKKNQIDAFILVLDDVDTDTLSEISLQPTYIIETSPGNHHIGFAITDRDNVAGYEILQKRLIAKGLMKADKSGNSTIRYVRLPGYINNKPEVIAEHGEPFITRLVEFAPERRYGVGVLARYFGVTLDKAEQETATASSEERANDSELVRQILTGDGYHDAMVKLAARWAQHGNMDEGEAIGQLRGMMLANPDRSDRWQARFSDIYRIVRSAWERYRNTQPVHIDLPFVRIDDIHDAEPPAPNFWIEDYMPESVVTMLGAHGGTGKSTLALASAVCLANGLPFLGKKTKHARVLFYSAEDPGVVLRWRLSAICSHLGVCPRETAAMLTIIDATEIDPVLFAERNHNGVRKGETTDAYAALNDYMAAVGANVLIVDNSSDTYDAEENNRPRVRGFIRALNKLVKQRGGAVLLLTHVDKNTAKGQGGGEGYSGSTAWHNSVRSRLFMSEKEDGTLLLEHQKSNLGARAEPVTLMRTSGGLLEMASADNPAVELISSAQRDAILLLIDEFNNRGEFVSTSETAGNAWMKLKGEPTFPKGLTKHAFWKIIRDAERAKLLFREDYTAKNRQTKTRFTTSAPVAPVAPVPETTATSAVENAGAPKRSSFSLGGMGEIIAAGKLELNDLTEMDK